MSHSVKRAIALIAIITASVAAGMILTADLGLMKKSNAQQTMQTSQGAVTSVTVPSFADLAQRVMPAVVSITTTEVVRDQAQRRFEGVDPFEFFFPDPRDPRRNPREQDEERKQTSGGSGFIISPDGYILTNNHVVEGATTVEVHWGSDDRSAEAKVVGRDPATDLALIKIDVKETLPTARLGNSDSIRVGDWAVAIGNPLQFSNTLTVGVISGTGRALGISETTQSFENFIQTDAAINFGNSGGPLLNIHGEVIGINTAIRAYAQNIGFATPINIATKILPQLREKGKVTRGYLGTRVGEIDDKTREAFRLPSKNGALVQSVEPGQPAERAGIQPGDVIVQVDSREVRRTRDLIDYISDQPPGTSVKITVIRNGQRRTLTATTAPRPASLEEEVEDAPQQREQTRDRIGISIQEITPALRQTYAIPDSARGVVITDVKGVSPAGDAGLAEGDVVTEINGQRVTETRQFRDAVQKARSGEYLRMYVTRYGRGSRSQSFFAIVKVP